MLFYSQCQLLSVAHPPPSPYGNLFALSQKPGDSWLFREIGRADELGSGVRKLMKYGKACGGNNTELVAGDIFRVIVKCPDFEKRQLDPIDLRPETEAQLEAQSVAILQALGKRPLSAK